MSQDDAFKSKKYGDIFFRKWFINYINNASLDDLKKEPLNWEQRTAFLKKKYLEDCSVEPR